MDRYALRVHVGQPLLEIDEFCRQWPARLAGCFEEKALFGHVELGIKTPVLRVEEIEVGLREIVGMDVDRAYASLRRRLSERIAYSTHCSDRSCQAPLQDFPPRHSLMTAASSFQLHGVASSNRLLRNFGRTISAVPLKVK